MPDRYLITTADERTWKFDRPVLFLGEWCRRFEREHIWSNMDAEIARPFGINIRQKEIDLTYLHSLSSQLLKELTHNLNIYHGTDHSLRYWHIVLGHWLWLILRIIYNRYSTLEQLMNNYVISGTTIFDINNYTFKIHDTISFSMIYENDIWNNILYAKILSFLGYKDFDFLTIDYTQSSISSNKINKSFRQIYSMVLNKIYNMVLNKFGSKHDAFIINSYLPKKTELILQVLIGQFPRLWGTETYKHEKPDINNEKKFNIDASNYKGFEKFIRVLISEIMPICYLEGYNQLVKEVKLLPWPTKPKFILTASNFAFDEKFKVWAAAKSSLGVPYYINQHGSNSTWIDCYNWWPEYIYTNKYFTWGWTGADPKFIPTFNFKIVNRKSRHNIIANNWLVLFQFCSCQYGPEDLPYKFRTYKELQFRFIKALPRYIQNKIIVRIHPTYHMYKDDISILWKKEFPHILMDMGRLSVKKLINSGSLIVHTYDSTGISETLGMNIPTLCFWPGKIDNLLPKAKPLYQSLKDAGIFADSPEYAAELVSLYWDDIGKWWNSDKVQNIRKQFCAHYGRVECSPLKLFSNHLL